MEDLNKELRTIEENLESLRKKKLEILYKLGEKDLDRDYDFKTKDGSSKKLSEMFGDQKYLFTIHNMGKGCAYCTMWGDSFNDTFKYIQMKGAFALISPNKPEDMKEFAESRGWNFDVYSDTEKVFGKDMGNYSEETGWHPGLSVFEKSDDGKIKRISMDGFGPGDVYCNVWHFYDLLPKENTTLDSLGLMK